MWISFLKRICSITLLKNSYKKQEILRAIDYTPKNSNFHTHTIVLLFFKIFLERDDLLGFELDHSGGDLGAGVFRRGSRNQLLRFRQQLLQLGRPTSPGRLFGLKVLQFGVQIGQAGLGRVGPLSRKGLGRFVLPAQGRIRAGTVGNGSNLQGWMVRKVGGCSVWE